MYRLGIHPYAWLEVGWVTLTVHASGFQVHLLLSRRGARGVDHTDCSRAGRGGHLPHDLCHTPGTGIQLGLDFCLGKRSGEIESSNLWWQQSHTYHARCCFYHARYILIKLCRVPAQLLKSDLDTSLCPTPALTNPHSPDPVEN